jgi:uncharacterized protein YjbJ (UPF0337 family)
MSSTTDKISGKTKQVVGKATNNKEMEIEGQSEQTKGDIKSAVKSVKDNFATKVDDIAQKVDR